MSKFWKAYCTTGFCFNCVCAHPLDIVARIRNVSGRAGMSSLASLQGHRLGDTKNVFEISLFSFSDNASPHSMSEKVI